MNQSDPAKQGPISRLSASARLLWQDALSHLSGYSRWVRRHPRLVLLAVIVGIGLVIYMIPHDREWLRRLQLKLPGTFGQSVKQVAAFLSKYGDFLGFNGLLISGLLVAAWIRKSHALRHAAVVAILGTLLTGLSANIFRAGFGRGRPTAKEEASIFHGPSLEPRYHSFPSGHTASAFGASMPLLSGMPVIGVPVTLVASGIAWARMQSNQHHPSDVTASILLSLIYGIPLGIGLRRRRQQRSAAQSLSPDTPELATKQETHRPRAHARKTARRSKQRGLEHANKIN